MNPLRDFLHKEIALYNHNHSVPVFLQTSISQAVNKFSNMPSFGSTELLINSFFSRLQDKYNVNTVPTVVRLTQKLQKSQVPENVSYPFCPLCLGIRDEINNLLEVGSTIRQIVPGADGKDEPISV
jgi:hypothetical protein